jgi:hypothetical protein
MVTTDDSCVADEKVLLKKSVQGEVEVGQVAIAGETPEYVELSTDSESLQSGAQKTEEDVEDIDVENLEAMSTKVDERKADAKCVEHDLPISLASESFNTRPINLNDGMLAKDSAVELIDDTITPKELIVQQTCEEAVVLIAGNNKTPYNEDTSDPEIQQLIKSFETALAVKSKKPTIRSIFTTLWQKVQSGMEYAKKLILCYWKKVVGSDFTKWTRVSDGR